MAGDIDGTTVFSNISLSGSGATLTAKAVVTTTQTASTLSSSGTAKVGGDAWFGSGISVGSSANTGSEIAAISAVTLTFPAQIVQGSASSFTLFAWPAVKPYDFIGVAPLGAAISSVSSGLVYHSHCTVAGQCEIRTSNVSTLVQNQSAIVLALYRISAF